MRVYKFRDCLLNTAERSVIKERRHLDLTTKTFDVLEFLIENAGKVVTKDEILGHVWNGNFVEESNLPVHISKLRRFLSESRDCRFIETVQGTGYRFVAPLQTVDADEWQAASSAIRGFPVVESVTDIKASHSIAVLPLQNEGGDPEMEYLADGLTEGLINGLSHVPGLRVIARNTVFRYKERSWNLKEVGEALSVSRILTGRVRLASNNLVVGVEVINAFDGTQIWGNQYNRPFADILDIQQDIVDVTLETLAATVFRPDTVTSPSGENPEAYKYRLIGRHLLRKHTTAEVYKAIDYFRRAISCCPTDVLSYASVVEAYYYLHVLDRISRKETLININPILEILSHLNQSFDLVQLLYGKLKLTVDWKAKAAEAHVRHALILNPNSVEAHSLYAEIMILFGKPSEAIKHANQILALDPISSSSFKLVARIFYKLGRYEEAIAFLNDAYELEPLDYETLLLLGASFAELRDYSESLRCLKKSYHYHQYIETLSMIGYVEALAGKTDGANVIIQQMASEFQDYKRHPMDLARIRLALGEKEEAYRLLEEAYAQREIDLYGLGFDPRLKAIQEEPRFKSLLQRVWEASDLEQ